MAETNLDTKNTNINISSPYVLLGFQFVNVNDFKY